MKEIGQLLLETGFLMAMPESPQQKQWRLGAHFREQHFSVHRPGLCEPLRQSSRNQHTRRASLCASHRRSAPPPRFLTAGYCSRGSTKLFPRMRWLPPGSTGKILAFQAHWAQVPREKNCICSLLHPLWEGHIVQRPDSSWSKGSNILWESPTPIPFPLTFPKFIWLCFRLHKL